MMRSIVSFVLVATVSSACGGGAPPPAEAPSPAPSGGQAPAAASAVPGASASAALPPPPAPPGKGEWDSWTKEQKLAYMKAAVMPKMGPMFHDFDAKTFAEPRCALCHGPGAKTGSFKMPNPELPKLPATPEGFQKLAAEHPQIMEFMGKQVVPTMAALLGEDPFDLKTQKGFGCFECHTKK